MAGTASEVTEAAAEYPGLPKQDLIERVTQGCMYLTLGKTCG
jgi:hypothetical protein